MQHHFASTLSRPIPLSSRPGRIALAALLLATAGVMGACATGQTGGQIGGDIDVDGEGATDGDNCQVTSREPIAADEVSALGFAPEELLEKVAGSHEASMRWGSENLPAEVTLLPAASDSGVAMEVTPDTGSVVLVHRAPPESNCEGECAAIDIDQSSSCADLISFEAAVTVTTDNGALADTFDATFTAKSAHLAHASIELAPGDQDGSFDVTTSNPDGEIMNVFLGITVADGYFSGAVVGQYMTTDGQVASGTGLDIAHFPIDSGCPEHSGSPIDPDGTLGTRGAAALEALDEFDFTWAGASSSVMTLTHNVHGACYSADPYSTSGSERVVLFTTTIVETADGGIEGVWELEAHVAFDTSSAPSQLSLIRQASLVSGVPGADFAELTGITAVEVDPTLDATFSFSIEDDLTDELGATGELTVIEIGPAPDCESDIIYDEDGNPVGANGCEGTPFEEVASGTLTAR